MHLLLLASLLFAQDNGPYRIGPGITPPKLQHRVEPEYSEEARKAHFQGTVLMSLVVDENGVPRQVKVVRPLGQGLDQNAVSAVAKWRFEPGMKDGRPVATIATIEVSFRLLDNPRIPLWPVVDPRQEKVVERGKDGVQDRAVSSIHNPSLEVFLPPVERRNGTSVIIAPGGGHRYLAIDHEGYRVAQWLREIGVTAFLLRYRLAKEEGSTYTVLDAAEDGRRAVRMVREKAQQYGLDVSHVGFMGFSAGGDVAARVGFSTAEPRPNFLVLMYPGIAQTAVSVDSNSPPTFIGFASNDSAGITDSSTQLFLSLRKAGVPVEMHVYAHGGHGFGIKPANHSLTSSWTARVEDWMGENGWLKKQ